MLYDNAQLARVYLHTWQVTGEPFYRAIVEETLDYVLAHPRAASVVGDARQPALGPCSTRVPTAIVLTRSSRLESPGSRL
jgi:hypothetical protein